MSKKGKLKITDVADDMGDHYLFKEDAQKIIDTHKNRKAIVDKK